AHGYSYAGRQDQFYLSAVENSLEFFEEEEIRATYFVIAKDLEDNVKRKAIMSIVKNGHHIASHGLEHLYLNQIPQKEK
ncbi:MAG: polysaccharide deacetylase family protein, partial [Calditrichae bacterium]|nr:polysaccharide deacetylase family protein [Calditrichia bacterium]